jgi:WD40 repeat protein
LVATCSADTTIKIWNISNPLNWTLIKTLREIANDVPEKEYVNNDTFAIGQGGAIKIRSLSNGSTLASFNIGHTSIFCLKLLSDGSVGDLDPVEVATGIFWWVATENGSRPRKKIRSRPTAGRDPKKKTGRDPWSVATLK